MSNGSQHKLYNYEVTPPAGVWEKIAAELDESELSAKFPSRLLAMQIAPPVQVWQRIAAALDEPLLVNDYAGKLSGLEIAPPTGSWNKIKTLLDQEDEKAIPARRRIAPFLKYAAAAVIIGFLAWGGIQLFDTKTGTTVAREETTSQKENIAINNGVSLIEGENIAVTDFTASMEEARNDAALEESKKTYAKLDAGVTRSKIKNAANFLFVADNYEPGNIRGLGIDPVEYSSSDLSNRYIIFMTPDGNIIRMSKKLRDLVCCVSGEEQDKDCIDQMKKWRDKIASPAATHSPGNFMDILSMVSSLQDN